MKSDVILKIENLTREFDTGGSGVLALDGIDAEIREGEFTVIMGPSGSGKSTFLYNTSGLDKPDFGTVLFRGIDIHKLNEKELSAFRRNKIGFVFQYLTLVQNLSVSENLLITGFNNSRDRSMIRKRAAMLLRMMGIEDLAGRFPTQISGGEQQRAALARALINNPEILFADEPTGTLNCKSGQEILNRLYTLNMGGQTILMVTHDIKAAAWGNRVLYLQDGMIKSEFAFPAKKNDPLKHLAEREKLLFGWLSGMGW